MVRVLAGIDSLDRWGRKAWSNDNVSLYLGGKFGGEIDLLKILLGSRQEKVTVEKIGLGEDELLCEESMVTQGKRRYSVFALFASMLKLGMMIPVPGAACLPISPGP